jgi:predicted DNA-binding transcriptional regulator YafY
VKVLDLKLADHSRHREVIQTVQWAMVKRRQLAGVYCSPYEAQDARLQLHPYRLCLVKAAWYLIARGTDEDAPRTYRVTRFKTLRMTDNQAQTPDDFDLKAYFGNAWAVYRGDRSYDVEILFNEESAATVTETIWHHTQKVRRHQDGSITLKFQVDGLNEIVRWVLGWGSRVKVIRPVELRDRVLDELNKSIRAYQT